MILFEGRVLWEGHSLERGGGEFERKLEKGEIEERSREKEKEKEIRERKLQCREDSLEGLST